ncbi:hypothetical protein M8J76_008694 [Diaphorina citri]|nr:hypothetical protein M8J75_003062 [Diaphorina citri]KAI5726794.1 hypothetical protein M8J76_008694 [Diaphorina citri]KAI5732359.1 hypothetical protein M8J77_025529 [Diaphorina citri]
MNIHQCPYGTNMSPSSPSNNNSTSPFPTTDITSKPVKMKRSFDVAFLMKPDDLSKKRQKFELKQHLQYLTSGSVLSRYSPPIESTVEHNGDSLNGFNRHNLNEKDEEDSKVVNAEPVVIDEQYSDYSPNESPSFTRSAFSKFDGSPNMLDIPPVLRSPSSVSTLSGGVSPDSCQDSLSPPLYLKNKSRSPISFMQLAKPIQFYNRLHPNTALPYFANALTNPYTAPYIINEKDKSPEENLVSDAQNSYSSKSPVEDSDKAKLKSAPEYMMYPGNGISPYVPCPFPPTAAVPLLTTAGSVGASLLPSSLAALTLPAQNVCAKCNVSFRMTSDLVYHMRSHHKADSIAQQNNKRRKDQDKLKCPVCNESFRERHHLTRHMTAHQDKDGDSTVDEEVIETTKRKHTAPHGNAK